MERRHGRRPAARHRREAELTLFICVRAALGAYLRGSPPQVCAEFARKVLFADTQPSLAEVEVATTLSSQAKAREASQPA